jgi:hypothetical protein
MKRATMLSAVVALVWAGTLEAQYHSVYYPYSSGYYTSAPTTTYYGAVPTTTYYASSPTTAYYGSAPTTTYYASSPTTVYYGSAPATTYYASSPTTVYYGAPPVTTSYYRPLVGRGITRVGYYTPAYPAAPVYQAYYPAW